MAAAWKAQAKPPVHQSNESFLIKKKQKNNQPTKEAPPHNVIIWNTSCMTEQFTSQNYFVLIDRPEIIFHQNDADLSI